MRRNDKMLAMQRKKWEIKDIEKLERMSGLGMTMEEIALVEGVSKDTLERALKRDAISRAALEKGRAVAKHKVTQTLYDMATSGAVPSATYFWLKCRAGWKEEPAVQKLEVSDTTVENRLRSVAKELGSDRVLKLVLELKKLPPGETCNLAQILSEQSRESLVPSLPPPLDGES